MDIFFQLLKSFQQTLRYYRAKHLIVLDNYESNISVGSIEFARARGLVILTLLPYSSHKLQLLDLMIFGSLKK